LADKYSVRTVEECILEIGRHQSTLFSSLDLSSGFWQMPLKESDQDYTAFTLPGTGQFKWTVGAMGLMGCPASFSRLMETVMADLPNVVTYIDDVLVHSRNNSQHLHHLEASLIRIRAHGLKLNLDKCDFAAPSIQYLGHTLNHHGITPGVGKMEALARTPPPTTVTMVKSLCGLLNYFRSYISQFARRAKPLFQLTSKNSTWSKGKMPEPAQAAFIDLKTALLECTGLAYPSPKGRMHLFTDSATASAKDPGGMGAFLMQADEQDKLRPLGHFSIQLLKHHENYPPFLLEAASAKAGMHHFRQLLRARPFSLHTKQPPKIQLNRTHEKTLATLADYIKDFSYNIEYVQGRDTIVDDYLTRYHNHKRDNVLQVASIIHVPAYAQVDLSMPVIMDLQQGDKELRNIMAQLQQGAHPATHKGIDAFELRNNILYAKRSATKNLLHSGQWVPAIPASLTTEIIKNTHDNAPDGHSGASLARDSIMKHMWWPFMGQQISDRIKECPKCSSPTFSPPSMDSDTNTLPKTARPCQRVHMDLFGPLKTPSKRKYILVVTDAFSKFTALAILMDKQPATVARSILDKWVCYMGMPSSLRSDNGHLFTDEVLLELRLLMGVKGASPQPRLGDDKETFNTDMDHTLRNSIYNASDTSDQWDAYLGNLQLAHNMRISTTTRMSPLELILGFQPLFPLWHLQDMTNNMATGNAPAIQERLLGFHQRTGKTVHGSAGNKNTQDSRSKSTFDTDQTIWIEDERAPKNQKHKKWLPAIYIKRLGQQRHQVRLQPGGKDKVRDVLGSNMEPRTDSSLANNLQEDTSAIEQETQDDLGMEGPVTRSRKQTLLQTMAVELSDKDIDYAIKYGLIDLKTCIPQLLAAMHTNTPPPPAPQPAAAAPPPEPPLPPVTPPPAPPPPPPPPPPRPPDRPHKLEQEPRALPTNIPSLDLSPDEIVDRGWKEQIDQCKDHWERCRLPDATGNLIQAKTGLIRVTTTDGLEIRLAASASAAATPNVHPIALGAAQSTAKCRYTSMEAANTAFCKQMVKAVDKARDTKERSNIAKARLLTRSPTERKQIVEDMYRKDLSDERNGLPTYHPAGPVHASHTLFFAHDKNNHPLIHHFSQGLDAHANKNNNNISE
jgi:hypothetical protein